MPEGGAYTAAASGPEAAPGRLAAMFRSGHASAAWFSATFLAHVSVDRVDEIVKRIEASGGDFKSVDGTVGDYTAHFAKGTNEVLVHLDPEGKINLLMFRPFKPQESSPN